MFIKVRDNLYIKRQTYPNSKKGSLNSDMFVVFYKCKLHLNFNSYDCEGIIGFKMQFKKIR